MTRPRARSEKVSIGFMAVWLIFWLAGMILVLFALGGAVMNGDLGAIFFMTVWMGAAGFGLYSGARTLRRLLLREGPARRPPVDQPWHDGMTERPKD